MRHLFSLSILLLSIPNAVFAQKDSITTGKLDLNIRSLHFIKNNEYFNPIGKTPFHLTGELPLHADKSLWIEGYTLTGFFFRPEMVYKPSERLTLRAGGHFLKYWGKEKIEIRPVFSTILKLSPSTGLTIGSLGGSDSHRMFDPHFNKERLYSDYAEDGFEIITNTGSVYNNTWLSWENFISKGDDEQEIFTFGESFRYTSPQFMEYMNIEVPLQFQFKHYGGQISDYPGKVTTFFNLAAGGRINMDMRSKGILALEYTGFFNSIIPEREIYKISDGNAGWYRLHYTLKRFYFGASYWLAEDFYAPNGNGIFTSIYIFDSDYIVHKRRIITGSASIDLLPADNLELFLGIDTYYDVDAERMDYALTLHLDFEKLFRLK